MSVTEMPFERGLQGKGNKKVVLFNTHLDNIIHASNILLPRLRYIFSFFAKREDIVLWWRPHPLSLATAKSMKSKFYEEYLQLVEEYKREHRGIYDTTSNLYRAIIISDAYLGDASSLVELYHMTGKPMMILEPLKVKSLHERYISFKAGAQKGEWIYFSALYFNGLFKINVNSKEIKYLGYFSTENLFQAYALHCAAHIYGDYCWFIPECGINITKVNLITLEMEAITLPSECITNSNKALFGSIVTAGHLLFLIPVNINCIIKIDLKTNQLTPFYSNDLKIGSNAFAIGGAFYKGYLWIYSPVMNGIISLNTLDGVFEYYNWNLMPNAFSGLAFDGQSIWFAPLEHPAIVRWNISTNELVEITAYPPDFIETNKKFYNVCYHDGLIWMFPLASNMILKIDPTNNNIQGLNTYPDDLKWEKNLYPQIPFFRVIESTQLFITLRDANMFLLINKDSTEGFSMEVTEEEYLSYMVSLKKRGIVSRPSMENVKTDKYYSLNEFTESIYNSNKNINDVTKDEGIIGPNIWKYIKSCILG